MTTKAEAKARKLEWSKALNEGRVVRYNNCSTLRSFKTIEGAIEFVNNSCGLAQIVKIDS